MMRFLVAVSLLIPTGAYVLLNPPENLALGRGILSACPTSFGEWNGTELSFADAVVDELHADDILIRRYQMRSETAWLCVIYHQNRRYGAHDPKLCYESQGYVVERQGRTRVRDATPAGLAVNRFVADRPHDRRIVYYWWTTQGLSTADVGSFRRSLALTGALDNRSWGAFVRVETLVRNRDDAAADSMATDLASRVASALPTLFVSVGKAPR